MFASLSVPIGALSTLHAFFIAAFERLQIVKVSRFIRAAVHYGKDILRTGLAAIEDSKARRSSTLRD